MEIPDVPNAGAGDDCVHEITPGPQLDGQTYLM
jgi:hypothetical protein